MKQFQHSNGVPDDDFSNWVEPLKLIYLSAHDTTITGFLSAIKYNPDVLLLPPLASQILIELSHENGKYFVSWSYNSEKIDLSTEYRDIHCDPQLDCDLEDFTRFLKKRSLGEDVAKACQGSVKFRSINWIWILIGVIGGSALFTLLAYCVVKFLLGVKR